MEQNIIKLHATCNAFYKWLKLQFKHLNNENNIIRNQKINTYQTENCLLLIPNKFYKNSIGI